MISVSGYKQFKQCERLWFYKNIVADSRVKNDLFRKEVTLLSKLQSIYAWRGSIVDAILSKYLVLAINNKYPIKKDYFIEQAMSMFNTQLEYAVLQKYREPDAVITNNPSFNAFLECELGDGVSDAEINQAKDDITNALTNILDDNYFLDYLKSAKYVISQRPLIYNFDRFSVKAIPDFIAFFDNSAPHIFDWKVHTYGTTSYDEQLIAYAVALFKVAKLKPHADFPSDLSKWKINDYKLTEYQLLHKDRIKRDYDVTDDKIEDFGQNMSSAIIRMHMAGANKKYSQLKSQDFSTTAHIENCQKCPFQKICKTDDYETVTKYTVRDEYFQN
ncbi:PD-(D/E)XK nuclease family protein [Ferruginibacter paludis]|uniref:PD-(D/E)XK nuclease family protein n=1 Tax=Ferruginibacter paludis TaxID=1310417 RepID=UPI0025B28384|nr:PD-(D/E)XK nuclease family protein [Ferruginibacter paludis]MDN3657848.1 PD-(D/E)XK nuclease family protein [Ferruginibacter paludis]